MRRLNEAISGVLNGLRAKKSKVNVINCKFVENVLKVLQSEGYVGEISKVDDRKLSVELKYYNRSPVIKSIKIVSHGGFKVYTKKIKSIPRNFSVRILSTSSGVMTHMQAVNLGIGGQVLLEVF